MNNNKHTTDTLTGSAIMLKRKFEETVNDSGGSATTSNGQSESDDSNCSNGSTDALAPEVASGPPPPKRMKKKVNFKGVSVFYFPRRQGFTCVPSEGGSTLGMSEKHSYMRDFTLADYTKEQKRIHRAILSEQRRQGKMYPSPLLASNLAPLDNEDVSSGSESDSEYDDYYFLQPLPIRQRRVLLRTAGVKKIDNEEKDDCRDIRVSRNVCGCDCKLFCDPATCSCSLAGIQCQVDRLSFPCGCTKDGCNNLAGRIEFNPIRVRTHFIHTLMRLELERTDSQCQDGKAATSFLHRPSAAFDEIDVVGAIGTESGAVSPENSNSVTGDFFSEAITEASTTEGAKILKSRLKTKTAEVIDLNMFNSNEKGSCRDCQNTDMCNVMMHDVKFSMVNQQQRQHQQRIISAMGPQPGYPGSQGPQLQHQHHHMSLSTGMSLLHPPPLPQQPSSQHMLLFNDGEEEVYRAENASSMYFDNDDSPYSEISDASQDVLEPLPFSNVSQASFHRKFNISPSHMFPSSINVASNGNNGSVHCQSLIMPKQTSLHNSSCIQSLHVSGGCGAGPSSTSCNSVGLEQQQPCSLLSHSHIQQQSAVAMSCQSLLRPPYLPAAPQLSLEHCVATPGTVTSSQALHSQNGLLTHMSNSLELDASDNSLMKQGTNSSYQSKFSHTDIMESVHTAAPSSYKLDSPIQANKSYSFSNSSVPSTNYLSQQPSHINFSVPAKMSVVNSTTPAVTNESNSSFQSIQTVPVQHSSCWSASLASPTLRECLGLDSSSPETASSSTDQTRSQLEISCNSRYQQEADSCAVTLSPVSPNSSTITYATMTTTTRDRLAAHCPGISSHMDGKPELTTSTLKDTAPSFSTYHMTPNGSDNSNLVGTSQNLLYDLSCPDTSKVESCIETQSSLKAAEQNIKISADFLMTNFTTDPVLTSLSSTSFSQPLLTSSPSVSTSFTSELSNTSSHLYSTVTSTCLPPTLFLSSVTSSTSLSGACRTYTEDVDMFLHNSHGFSKESLRNAQGNEIQNVTSTTDEGKEDSLYETISRESTPEHPNLVEAHLDNWNRKYNLKGHKEGNIEDMSNVQCESLSSEIPDIEYEQDRNYDACATDSEVVSSLSSSTAQSTTSSSSSSPTSEEDKDQTMSQGFAEIIKETIVELVLA